MSPECDSASRVHSDGALQDALGHIAGGSGLVRQSGKVALRKHQLCFDHRRGGSYRKGSEGGKGWSSPGGVTALAKARELSIPELEEVQHGRNGRDVSRSRGVL